MLELAKTEVWSNQTTWSLMGKIEDAVECGVGLGLHEGIHLAILARMQSRTPSTNLPPVPKIDTHSFDRERHPSSC
jgi:hypothetical protein